MQRREPGRSKTKRGRTIAPAFLRVSCKLMSVGSATSGFPIGSEFRAILEQFSRERVQYDLELRLQEAVKTAQRPYSFWRLKGFQDISAAFCSATAAPDTSLALQHLLTLQWSAVLQTAVETISPFTSQADATVTTHWNGKGVSEAEQTEAMKVLQVLCLIHATSRDAAGKAGMIEALVNRLRRFSSTDAACACMNALLAMLLDNDPNQARFVQLQGIEKAALLLRAEDTPVPLRKRTAEFLHLLVTQVLPEGPPVDLRRRAERSLQAQLGLPASQVLLEQINWSPRGDSTGIEKDDIEFQLQDVAAAALARLAAD